MMIQLHVQQSLTDIQNRIKEQRNNEGRLAATMTDKAEHFSSA